MLVLSESPIGFALFSVTDEGKIGKDDLYKDFETAEGANSLSVFIPCHQCGLAAFAQSSQAPCGAAVEYPAYLVGCLVVCSKGWAAGRSGCGR